jgi:hypothetical protein
VTLCIAAYWNDVGARVNEEFELVPKKVRFLMAKTVEKASSSIKVTEAGIVSEANG